MIEVFELFASEYGYTKDEFEKLTMREISALIDVINERKTGKKRASVKFTEEQEAKIKTRVPANFKERKNVRS